MKRFSLFLVVFIFSIGSIGQRLMQEAGLAGLLVGVINNGKIVY